MSDPGTGLVPAGAATTRAAELPRLKAHSR